MLKKVALNIFQMIVDRNRIVRSLILVTAILALAACDSPSEKLIKIMKNDQFADSEEKILKLIDQGVNVNLRDGALSPLGLAAENNNTVLIGALIQRGANVDLIHDDGTTPLLIACVMGHKESVELLIKHGANVNGFEFYSPLLAVARLGHLDIVELLVDAGADPDVRANNGNRPIHLVAKIKGSEKAIQVLIDAGAQVSPSVRLGLIDFLPIDLARKAENKTVTRMLQERIDLSATLMEKAFESEQANDIDYVKELIRLGLVVNQNMACHAISEEKLTLIKFLFSEYFDVKEHRCYSGKSPLLFAVVLKNEEMVEYFLSISADPNKRDDLGYTPLLWASTGKSVRIVKALLENGGDIELVGSDGYTPLERARKYGSLKVVALIQKFQEQ